MYSILIILASLLCVSVAQASKEALVSGLANQIDETLKTNRVAFGSSPDGTVSPTESRKNFVNGLSEFLGAAEYENLKSLVFESKVVNENQSPDAPQMRASLKQSWEKTSSQLLKDFTNQRISFSAGKLQKRDSTPIRDIFLKSIKGVIAVPQMLFSVVLKGLSKAFDFISGLFKKLWRITNINTNAAFIKSELNKKATEFLYGGKAAEVTFFKQMTDHVQTLPPTEKEMWYEGFKKLPSERKVLTYFHLARQALPDFIRDEDKPSHLFQQDVKAILALKDTDESVALETIRFPKEPVAALKNWAKITSSLDRFDAQTLLQEMTKNVLSMPAKYRSDLFFSLLNVMESEHFDLAYHFVLDWDHVTEMSWLKESHSDQILQNHIKRRLNLLSQGPIDDSETYLEYILSGLRKINSDEKRDHVIQILSREITHFHQDKPKSRMPELFEKMMKPAFQKQAPRTSNWRIISLTNWIPRWP